MAASNPSSTERQRLDNALVARGLAPSRSRARDLIRRGLVLVDGRVVQEPGYRLADASVPCLVAGAPGFVSRGAEKLIAALDHFGLAPAGRVGLDVGASTGGFSEVLLLRGARRVYAVDVGHGQLHSRLRSDPRVVALEGTDARGIDASLVPEPVGAIVADLSFIALAKSLGPALDRAAPDAWLVALIKPQFEVGPAQVGKGGIVRDPAARQAAVEAVTGWLAAKAGWRVLGVTPSPIAGGSGNLEFLVGARRND
jgi:23S rRNA (cytidine1920-2'-O)/16S rRNA (cytidine1409-2'-O)-methyltransferase